MMPDDVRASLSEESPEEGAPQPIDPATEKQIALLVQLGMKPEIASTLSKNGACIEIRVRMDQPTIRQKVFLLRRGFSLDVIEAMSKEEVKQVIGEIMAQLRGLATRI